MMPTCQQRKVTWDIILHFPRTAHTHTYTGSCVISRVLILICNSRFRLTIQSNPLLCLRMVSRADIMDSFFVLFFSKWSNGDQLYTSRRLMALFIDAKANRYLLLSDVVNRRAGRDVLCASNGNAGIGNLSSIANDKTIYCLDRIYVFYMTNIFATV